MRLDRAHLCLTAVLLLASCAGRPDAPAPATLSCPDLAAAIEAGWREQNDSVLAKVGEMYVDLAWVFIRPDHLNAGVLPDEDPIRLSALRQEAKKRCPPPNIAQQLAPNEG
ncbi:hypothetical protein CKO28_01330 [Rhodovibrio sodomensis]|uniref:Lipoprotein n=1 Tax=Rhodovibrio sodomensis TaxID=1088 RepID=A0ABS1D9N6_9PROT|nr:hypothetical protein [Rhodovibrio sodomensis]MBK1666686.1 hypothetical protein [Rhodovibrio sodomensis]